MPPCCHCRRDRDLYPTRLSGRTWELCGVCLEVSRLLDLVVVAQLTADDEAAVRAQLKEVTEHLLTTVEASVAARYAGISDEEEAEVAGGESPEALAESLSSESEEARDRSRSPAR